LFSLFLPSATGKIEALINTLKNKDLLPDIILLDINMPVMDGWDHGGNGTAGIFTNQTH
jgi:hypothetical protein